MARADQANRVRELRARERDASARRHKAELRGTNSAGLRPPEAPGTPPATLRPRGPEVAGWREEVAGASGLNVLAGIWLIISPFVLGFTDGDAIWNPIVFGAIVGSLAMARVAGAYRESWLSWVNGAIGVWLFISAFWLADSDPARWNNWIMGVIVFVLGLWSARASDGATARREH